MMKHILLSLIEPDVQFDWKEWLKEEISHIRTRFGDDEEAKEYFPDNYYENMEKWWNSSNNIKEPIEVYYDDDKILRIIDGWHRVAISHKLGLKTIPAIIKQGK